MALFRKCDRCSREVVFDKSSEQGWHYIRIDDNSTYDICPQCCKDFVKFMEDAKERRYSYAGGNQ